MTYSRVKKYQEIRDGLEEGRGGSKEEGRGRSQEESRSRSP